MARTDIREQHARSLRDPETFWAEAAEWVHFFEPYERVLDARDAPFYRWFAGGTVNTCYQALDAHVESGRAEQLALIYDSPVTGTKESFTYRALRDRVARFAGALAALGVGKGDRVLIYMPMIPDAVVAMLATARLGAVHTVVFGGFAASELATRIDDATPKVIVAASCGVEPSRVVAYKPLLDAALARVTHRPLACVIRQRPEGPASLGDAGEYDFEVLVEASAPVDCVPVLATDPLYILYTSGTTGQPKGVVRDNGGHMVGLRWSMQNVYGVSPGEVFFAASDVGWVVGHSYIVYGPLLHGCTTVLYEGKPVGTPDPGVFFRVIEEYGVHVFFTAPTAFRAIKRDDPEGVHLARYDLRSLRALFLAGERSDGPTLTWAETKLGVPVIDNWWQTETGWPIASNCLGIGLLPVKHGSPTLPVPGWDVRVLDDSGAEQPAGQAGALVVKLPLPPGALTTLYRADQRFVDSYLSHFPGYYETADAGYLDEDGYVFVMARTDDIINVAGHRLSTGAMEEALAGLPDVAECAVIGVEDTLKGELPFAFLVLNAGVSRPDEELIAEAVARVRGTIGPVAAFKLALVVRRLPKTRSGKILRGAMKAIADGRPKKVPATIDDPAILDEIRAALATVGYPQRGSSE